MNFYDNFESSIWMAIITLIVIILVAIYSKDNLLWIAPGILGFFTIVLFLKDYSEREKNIQKYSLI